MSLTIEATYENGVLKPAQALPLREHTRVRVTVEPVGNPVDETYGMVGWTGDVETLDRLTLDAEFDPPCADPNYSGIVGRCGDRDQPAVRTAQQ